MNLIVIIIIRVFSYNYARCTVNSGSGSTTGVSLPIIIGAAAGMGLITQTIITYVPVHTQLIKLYDHMLSTVERVCLHTNNYCDHPWGMQR